MENETISVILPVRNGEKWIGTCLESILAQTYDRFEVLVLDDHSQDGTRDIVETLCGKDGRIRLLQPEKRGVSCARNLGLEEAKGAYVTFVDADDWLDPGIFALWRKILHESGGDMVLCGHAMCADGGPKKAEPFGLSARDGENISAKEYLSRYLLHGNSHCWGILYRRPVIGSVRFRENLTIGEDLMFLVDLLPALRRVSVTDACGYYYRINQSGVMLCPFLPAYMDEMESWRLAAERIQKDYPQLYGRVSAILAVSAVLTAGKLALLSRKERRRYGDFVRVCQQTVREALKTAGAKKELPKGYGIKTALVKRCPKLYMSLYHAWKLAGK